MNTNQLSKLISLALRHQPEHFNLTPDTHGWVPLSDLLKGLHHYDSATAKITVEDIKKLVKEAPKRRHEISGNKIRALYGHSSQNIAKISKTAATPPPFLYHGTSRGNWASIQKEGLTPQTRQYVHLSEIPQDALSVGRRKGSDVLLLRIDATSASHTGVTFYRGNENIWLVDQIPARFIEIDNTEAYS